MSHFEENEWKIKVRIKFNHTFSVNGQRSAIITNVVSSKNDFNENNQWKGWHSVFLCVIFWTFSMVQLVDF